MDGVELIAAERKRQISEEGWTPEHDDEHVGSEMLDAATSYIIHSVAQVHGYKNRVMPCSWPWQKSWWKPSDDPIRNLAKAGALLAAEIDRLQRLGGKTEPENAHDYWLVFIALGALISQYGFTIVKLWVFATGMVVILLAIIFWFRSLMLAERK